MNLYKIKFKNALIFQTTQFKILFIPSEFVRQSSGTGEGSTDQPW